MAVTVLVVEDEMKICDLVRRYLEREDLAVVTKGAHDMTVRVPVESADGTNSVLDLSVTGDCRV